MKDFGDESGMIEKVLLLAIVLLLLVVLIPAGIALVQRIRAGTPERPVDRRPAAEVPTAKIPPLQGSEAPPPAAAPPAPPLEPKAGATIMAPMPAPQPEGGATVMVEWYGLLQCTAGALEGQRFIVDERGLYIGRDPAMSQITIADNRISKRHVRIIPRDGKVMAIDQNSTNGTFLGKAGGERITEVQLKRGDVLVLADNAATFVYSI
jgi:hypothetical protein